MATRCISNKRADERYGELVPTRGGKAPQGVNKVSDACDWAADPVTRNSRNCGDLGGVERVQDLWISKLGGGGSDLGV